MGASFQKEELQARLANMKGFTSPLWPIRYRPLPDELLSCWLVRLAHGHGLKAQTFCSQIFGSERQVWNRDIDRLAQPWLIEELAHRTGLELNVVHNTTLRSYEGLLYPKFRTSGALNWILVQQMYHRKRQGFGLQYCAQCLAEDVIPYFRKSWRLALNTVCIHHGIMLHDRCSVCGNAVSFHRLDMIKQNSIDEIPLSICSACGFDLRRAPKILPISYNGEAANLLLSLNHEIQSGSNPNPERDLGYFSVMHHLCRMMVGKYKHLYLRAFVLDQLGSQDIQLKEGHISFEMRPLLERHHLLQLTAWLLVDIEARLPLAWHARVIRYNLLLKDFPNVPGWYLQIVGKFSNWRDRIGN